MTVVSSDPLLGGIFVRLCSALISAALFFTQTCYAFDATSLNFKQQALKYNALDKVHAFSDVSRSFDKAEATTAITTAIDDELPRQYITSVEKDWDYLLKQTTTIFGLSVVTVGLMTFLPESITKWDSEDRDISRLGSKWWSNISNGPIWDEDEHYLNYIMHPYFGGVYYTSARHAGFNEFESFIYSFTMSTFFWEAGVEAFAEIPSIQDIIATPLFGALVGELMYEKEKDIIAKGKALGSETLANISLFFLNPVGHIHHWLTNWWDLESSLTLTQNPWFDYKEAKDFAYQASEKHSNKFIGLQFSIKF